MTPNRLDEKKANRFRFLNALYESTDGRTNAYVEMWPIGQSIGLSAEETSDVLDYLVNEGLAKHVYMGGGIGITHAGVRAVEKALSEPTKPTQYFPAIFNITNVHAPMTNSPILQGGHSSVQSVQLPAAALPALTDFVNGLAAALPSSGLSVETRKELEAELASIRAQIASPKPKAGMVVEGLRSIRTIFEGAMGSVLASEWMPKLLPLLDSLTAAPPI